MYTVLQPIHLGSGQLGETRKKALEQLAAEAGCFWDGQPSIGRFLKKLANERIQKMIQEMLKTMLEMDAVEDSVRETVEGMIGADLSEDAKTIAEYVSDDEDYEGLLRYIDAVSGK